MGSIHNDLHTWAGNARSRGQETIYIDLATADKAADTIVALATEVESLRNALDVALTGGNHIASQLIGRIGAGFSSEFPEDEIPEIVLRRLGATVEYDMWCAWAALMRARDIAEKAKP